MKIRKKKSLTIRSEIFLLSFLFLTLVSLIFSGIFLKLLYNHNIKNAKNSLKQCNSQIVTYTEGIFHENGTIIELLAKNPAVIYGSKDPEKPLPIYEFISQGNQNVTYIYSGYEDGTVCVYGYTFSEDYNPTTRPWYQAASNTDGVARLVYCDVITGEWLFSQCKKILDSDGNMMGVISIDCSNESISNQLKTKYQYESQRSYIINSEGMVLIHPEEKYINDSLLHYIDKEVWNDIITGKSNNGSYKRMGIDTLAYFEKIPETDFIVVTAVNNTEVVQPIIRGMEYLIFLVICISILLGFILSRILIYRFARPIIALQNRISKVAEGVSEPVSGASFSNVEINEIADNIEVIVNEIAKREEQQKAAEYLSFHDSLTGIYNRRFFKEELCRLDSKRNYPLCIICCDINGLKLINDVFGHDAGDKLILRVTKCLKESCRSDDILARMGGDEFSIILPKTSAKDADGILERIRRGFLEEIVCGTAVTASLGYALKDKEEETLEDIMQQADKMMYAEKMRKSAEIRQNTKESILKEARKEGFVKALTEEENRILEGLAIQLCPSSVKLLKESYEFRNIGYASIFQCGDQVQDVDKHHTEIGYRMLCVFSEYRNVAGCILHYMEHWDGSGWTSGLSGRDIPLISRIIAVVNAYFQAGENMTILENHRSWYDPDIVVVLKTLIKTRRSV